MKKSNKNRATGGLLALAVALTAVAIAAPKDRPNIIFILADDLGYGDVGFSWEHQAAARAAARIATPNLDRLAHEGAVLTDHYCASPVCAPSRASLLTGRVQGACSLKDNCFDQPFREKDTLGSVLHDAGYATWAVGKWGLAGGGESGKPVTSHPLDRGFDYFYGFLDHMAGHTYYHYAGHIRNAYMGITENRTDATKSAEGIYSTDLFMAKAKALITEHAARRPDQPFFLYLAVNTIHGSGQSDATLACKSTLHVPGRPYPADGVTWPLAPEPLAARNTWINPAYADLPPHAARYATAITRFDEALGDLLRHLERHGLDRDTMIVFTSDNGPADEYGADPRAFTSAGPFDGLKRDVFEGGLRVPTCVRWPARVPAGTVDRAPSQFHDWIATLADAAGTAKPASSEGVSLLPRWDARGKTAAPASLVYTQYEFPWGGGSEAYRAFAARKKPVRGLQQFVREGDYVALRTRIREGQAKVRLYDVVHDPFEERDLADEPAQRERLARLTAVLDARLYGVKSRGLFINDEDWGLRPWAVKHFGKKQQIGERAYAQIFDLMRADGLNLLWPAMHEGGYEFVSRPENMALAAQYGIRIGTSHCEPMLRNNCYLSNADKKKWSWTRHRDFITDYWRWSVDRYATNDVLWTIGLRGIHDGKMKDGDTREEKIAVLEDVFATQCGLLEAAGAGDAPKLFVPYKEVLPIYNAGLKVPKGTTIMWVNDNFGYVRRLGGPQCDGYGQGIYWHAGYYGRPHSYTHLCTTPPAFMWYELVAKCWENGVRDVWMVNAGDVFQADIILYALGRFAANPERWKMCTDAQSEVLADWVRERLLPEAGADAPVDRIVAHLNEFYALGFIRKPEHMCVQWSSHLPPDLKAELLARYRAFLAEDLAIEDALHQLSTLHSQLSTLTSRYFRLVGFQAQFLAHAGLIHLEGRGKEDARAVLDPLYARWDALDGGRWSGFWIDTITEKDGTGNRWSSQMQWPWNEPDDPTRKDRHGESRADYRASAYCGSPVPTAEPRWLEPVAVTGANGGAWMEVKGLGTSGRARALLPVKPGVGEGARLAFSLSGAAATSRSFADDSGTLCAAESSSSLKGPGTDGGSGAPAPRPMERLVLQFLPDFALWPGMKLRVKVAFDDGAAQEVEVPKSDSNIGEKDPVRNAAVQDNFIRVRLPIPAGATAATVTAVDPGVVLDRVGVE